MIIEPCRSYHAQVVGRHLLRMPDALSVFKVYFVSIVGRDEPSRYEWGACRLAESAVLEQFAASGEEGIGFVTAFPHITKVFRYAPDSEILLHVRAFRTDTMESIDLTRCQGYTEFACYAEAAIAADEYAAWARLGSVQEYLDVWSPVEESPIADSAKLRAYWQQTD